jgi:hypothetical protein
MLASRMSAMQMADGGAVRTCKLIVSSVDSGSRDIIRNRLVFTSDSLSFREYDTNTRDQGCNKQDKASFVDQRALTRCLMPRRYCPLPFDLHIRSAGLRDRAQIHEIHEFCWT